MLDNQKFLSIEDFRDCLKKHGMKVTPQRIAVHEAMLTLRHASADMICELIAMKDGAKVTVASVYNILTSLASRGFYSHRLSNNNKMYFDVVTSDHIHMYDTVNHTFTNVQDDGGLLDEARKLLSKRFKGYKLDRIDIQILAHPTSRRRR